MSTTTLTKNTLHISRPVQTVSKSVADLFPDYIAFANRFESREESIIAAQLNLTPEEAASIGAVLVK